MNVLTLEGLTRTFQRAGTVVDGLSLKVEEGEFFTLLGPSGCGKSTVLRMIAGFETPDSGRILLGARDVTHDPPHRRGIGMVFQNYALFPHLSVGQNVSFGLEVRGVSRSEAARRVDAALAEVSLAGHARARVDQLSGGQQQRVALARALVIRPALLLLDEPLSNLDAKLRDETRAALRALHHSTGVTTVYVTHDQAEAMGMSGRIAVMNRGRAQQVGPPVEIYERPANRFVAGFIGRNNVVDAVIAGVDGDRVTVRFANGSEMSMGSEQRAPAVELRAGSRVGVCLRAESLRPSSQGLFSGVFADVEYSGASRSCLVETDVGPLRIEISTSSGHPSLGEPVRLAPSESAAQLVGPE
ncbi:MAG TPA: ABC transporter ATP-binding protein [Terriglobia bacterium]|nr:ABC transporter ATP-binding protein [Terriglobia bacterium]